MLAPYSRRVFGRAGQQGETAFTVYNNSDRKRTIRLELEFPGSPWPAELSERRVVLGPKGTRDVAVRYTVPAEGTRRACHLRAMPAQDPEFSTYSTLTAAGLAFAEPILVSKQCIGLAAHSGIPSSVVSRGDKVHVVWAEATDPTAKVPGVPTYVATYDRGTHALGKPALVGYGPPANDIHNSPSITMDGKGYLHVLVGTHGQPFPYARSLVPNDAGGGWTKPVPAGEGTRQTYIGLVCGPDDTLHAVFRLWRSGQPPFPASQYGTLAYQRKRPGQPWEAPRVLVVPPFSEYSVYYHRLSIDRRGRLFLSYDYWSTYWFYRNDHLGERRALLTSPDGGQTWKLAEDRDL